MAKVYVIPLGAIAMTTSLILDLTALRLPWGVIYDPVTQSNLEVLLPYAEGNLKAVYVLMMAGMLLALLSAFLNVRDYRGSFIGSSLAMISATSSASSITLFVLLSWGLLRFTETGIHAALISMIIKLLGAVFMKAPLGAIVVEVVKPYRRHRYQITISYSLIG
ncbi:MAG: hypothetical protein J7L11_01490 [Thermoprotei archaeon]|nr:hypothetical protein [Thermoprotei archaeon]